MSNVFFISDTHFDHERIMTLCKRPFDKVEDMNDAIITNWNERVKPGDLVYHLGDFSFGSGERVTQLLRMLNGQVHLVAGNHDHKGHRKARGWASVEKYRTLSRGALLPVQVVLFHWPVEIWDHRHHGSVHLFGHLHEYTVEKPTELRTNVGVDANGFAPVSIDELKVKFEGRLGCRFEDDGWQERFLTDRPGYVESRKHENQK